MKNELTLQCHITGRPKITWFKDNYNISNNRYFVSGGDDDDASVRRLTIRSPVASDFGTYTCRAEERHQINELSIRIDAADYDLPDIITSKRRDAAVDTSYRARSRRSHSRFADKPIARRSESQHHQHPSSAIEELSQFRDAKRRPTFSTQLRDRTAAEGSAIKLTCQTMGVDTCIEWFRLGSRLDGHPRYALCYADGLATLEIFSCRPSDSGEYTCTVRNQFGESSCSARFKVFPDHEKRPMPPIFTRSMKGSCIYI